MSELDPMPWVTVEPPTYMNGGSFQRTTSDRSSEPGPGRFFVPRFGYAQWQSEYPAIRAVSANTNTDSELSDSGEQR